MKRRDFLMDIGLGTASITLPGCVTKLAAGNGRLPEKGKNKKPNIEKAFISFRIAITQWMPENRFSELLDLFEKYKGVTDEITFFTSETHPPLPLEVIKMRAELLAQRMPKVRELGYQTGINILSTIGHHNENLPNSLSGDYTPMTDIDGNICQGSLCPNDEKMREYIGRLYEIITSANPDYIWIDDDVRLYGHKPITLSCFCDNCLAIFEKESGVKYTRQTLRASLNNGTIEKKLKLRKSWLQHNRNTIARLFELIEQTVHQIKPGMPLGFMTGDRFFEGYDFNNWAKILSGPGKAEVRWRPGGGFYTDERTPWLAGKSHSVGRQVSVLPDEVISIQSEIENFTYQRLKKSAGMTVLEAASHIAAGCTGAAFNVLTMYNEPLDEYEPLVAKIRKTRPFFDIMARTLGRKKLSGIRTCWGKDTAATCHISEGNWFYPNYMKIFGSFVPDLFEIGLPSSYSSDCASVTLLSEDNILALKEDEIPKILSSGVYMDAPALTRLNKMGYQDLTGFAVESIIKLDCIEKFTNHPLNGEFTGRERDNRWRTPSQLAYTLEKRDEKAETLSKSIDYADKETASCIMGIFENRLGGRVCIAGYSPWAYMHNLSKSSQMKSIMRWLSKERLPAYVSSFHKINLWVREPEKGEIALAFTNSYFDTAKDMTLMILTDRKKIKVFDMNCSEMTIRSSGSDGAYNKFIIPEVDPWQMRLVLT